MGGLFGIGGSAAKTDRSNTLTGFSSLKNLFNFGLPTAESAVGSGIGALSTAGNYWQKLLSGNRSTVEQAVAPETNATRAASDAQKRQLGAVGTARGGGVNATNQQRQTETQAKIDNLIFSARPQAAEGLANVGQAEAGIGTNLFATSETAASDLTALSIESKKESDAQAQAQGAALGDAISALLMFA